MSTNSKLISPVEVATGGPAIPTSLRIWLQNVCNTLTMQGSALLQRHDAVTNLSANSRAGFIWKLPCYWLKGLQQRHVTVVIQAPGCSSQPCYMKQMKIQALHTQHIFANPTVDMCSFILKNKKEKPINNHCVPRWCILTLVEPHRTLTTLIVGVPAATYVISHVGSTSRGCPASSWEEPRDEIPYISTPESWLL